MDLWAKALVHTTLVPDLATMNSNPVSKALLSGDLELDKFANQLVSPDRFRTSPISSNERFAKQTKHLLALTHLPWSRLVIYTRLTMSSRSRLPSLGTPVPTQLGLTAIIRVGVSTSRSNARPATTSASSQVLPIFQQRSITFFSLWSELFPTLNLSARTALTVHLEKESLPLKLCFVFSFFVSGTPSLWYHTLSVSFSRFMQCPMSASKNSHVIRIMMSRKIERRPTRSALTATLGAI